MKARLPLAWDLLSGAIIGLLLCYAITRLMGVDADALIFRYAGY